MNIGSFEQITSSMIISDPSYTYDPKDDVSFSYVIDRVKEGKYNVYVTLRDNHVESLMAVHSILSVYGDEWKETGSIGVDTRQAGIYDLSTYRDDNSVKEYPRTDYEVDNPGDEWYNVNSIITTKNSSSGVLLNGTVSSSGYGDGEYPVYTLGYNNNVIGVKIVFIDEGED